MGNLKGELPLGHQIKMAMALAGHQDGLKRTQRWLAAQLNMYTSVLSDKLSDIVPITEGELQKINEILGTDFQYENGRDMDSEETSEKPIAKKL